MGTLNFYKRLGFAFSVMVFTGVATAQKLDMTSVAKYSKMLAPDKSELWRTIRWKISLLEAAKEASRQGKPLFIWAMDGHPLACV